MNKIKSLINKALIAIMLIAINVSAFYIGVFDANYKWKKELISRRLAEYDNRTGEWKYSLVHTSDLFGPDPLAELDDKLPFPEEPKKKKM